MTAATPAPGPESTFRLMYRSHDLIPIDQRKRQLGTLFGAARSHNKSLGITGALLMSADHFVQVLEGEEDVVRGLYAAIAEDPRHDSVELLEDGMVPERVFARWSMARVGEDGEADVPLIAHTDGISPSAGRRITPEQEQVLAVMRSAATSADSSVG